MSENGTNDLEAIKARKMQELQRRFAASQKPQPPKSDEVDDVALVRSKLVDRGDEVLDAAVVQYPKATQEVIRNIAKLYRAGKIKEPLPGEELIALFQDLGIPVHLKTTITFIKDGKRVPLSQKFKKEADD